jgi:hypothetical protein
LESLSPKPFRRYQRNLYLASVAMLGCASERAIWLLINAFLDAVSDTKNRDRLRSSISGREISTAYKRFRASFDSVRGQLPSSLHAEFDVHIDAVFQFTRLQRNAVLHPSTLPSVTHAVAYASLQQFSYYLPTVGKVIAHLAGHPITL